MQKHTIEYFISLQNKSEHTLKVHMKMSLEAAKAITVCLPAWILGSYMVRDFARNLHRLTLEHTRFCNSSTSAKTSAAKITQIDKQTWNIESTQEFDYIELSYIIFAHDLSVRSAYIDDEYCFFNGTSVFLYVPEMQDIEHKVTIDEPSFQSAYGCTDVATAMPLYNKVDGEASKSFACHGYLEAIDHPFLLGKFEQYTFEVDSHIFHLVFTGKNGINNRVIADDLTPIIKHHIELFGDFPCDEYWFMTLVSDAGYGGLEHTASTVLQYNRYDLQQIGRNAPKINDAYQQFLGLCSHELFHTWHVKRIKPQVMVVPDLSREVFTEQLWIYEGFTSYYDDFSLLRSKVIDEQAYLSILEQNFTRLLKNHGRTWQSASQSSFEAWSKFYKQDLHSINHIVSYYNKGAVIALCLDITLREMSNGAHSLDDVMRHLWLHYGKPQIGTPNDVIQSICLNEWSIDISEFLHNHVYSTNDIDYQSILAKAGLKLTLRGSAGNKDKGGQSEQIIKHDIGANYTEKHKMLQIKQVYYKRAANSAELMSGDLIVAVNNSQCTERVFISELNSGKTGDALNLHVLRDNRLIELCFPLLPSVEDTCEISIDNREKFEKWVTLDT